MRSGKPAIGEHFVSRNSWQHCVARVATVMKWINIFVCLFDPFLHLCVLNAWTFITAFALTLWLSRVFPPQVEPTIYHGQVACIAQAESRTVAILKPYKPNPLYVSSTYVIHNHEGTELRNRIFLHLVLVTYDPVKKESWRIKNQLDVISDGCTLHLVWNKSQLPTWCKSTEYTHTFNPHTHTTHTLGLYTYLEYHQWTTHNYIALNLTLYE